MSRESEKKPFYIKFSIDQSSKLKFRAEHIRDLFLKKCEGKGVEYNLIEQFFPSGLIDALKPHLKDGLTRLTSEELPELEDMLDELRRGLEKVLL